MAFRVFNLQVVFDKREPGGIHFGNVITTLLNDFVPFSWKSESVFDWGFSGDIWIPGHIGSATYYKNLALKIMNKLYTRSTCIYSIPVTTCFCEYKMATELEEDGVVGVTQHQGLVSNMSK